MIYSRIYSKIDDFLPKEQGGFRKNRSCCDQVLDLTTYIERGFQERKKTGVVFMDLTAAYDTVWKNGLLLKLYKTLKCSQTVKLIEEMLSNRKFRVFLGEKSSKIQTLNNGLPRGAVLSPLLFNLYTQDIPNTNSRKFIYADDIAIATQDEHFQNLNTTLSEDVKILYDFFRNWRLTPNPSKTTTSCFHLNNRNKQTELNIFYNGTRLKHNHKPTYLGVTLDTSLTYNSHSEKLKQKLKTRNNLIHNFAGTIWGANASI